MKQYIKTSCIVLLILTAINATVAGVLFIIDPSGSKMGLTLDYIADSPFRSYLIPGIILLIINGLFNFITALLMIKNKSYSNILVILQGILLMGWIVIQVDMVKDISPLHIIMFIIGALLAILGYLLKYLKAK
jgi:hypothetical protein